MTFKLILFCILISTSFASQAQTEESSCAPRNFRPQLGAARDQGDLSWCFAFTSADLISQKVGRNVSAADLASSFLVAPADQLLVSEDPKIQDYLKQHPDFINYLKFARDDQQTSPFANFQNALHGRNSPNGNLWSPQITGKDGLIQDGGDEAAAILLSNLKGLCLEKDYPSNAKEVLKTLSIAKRNLEKSDAHNGWTSGAPSTDPASVLMDARSNAIMESYLQELDRKCQRFSANETLLPIHIGPLSIKKYDEAYPPKSQIRSRYLEGLMTKMNHALDEGKAVAIDYSYYAVMPRGPKDTDDGDHASVIAGRKMIGGVCHYLLRNSFGADCSVRPELKSRCQAGHTWVTASELKSGELYAIDYLK